MYIDNSYGFVHADCQEYFENGYTADGIYTLKLNETTSIDAWCEFDADNGWTVILHRDNSSVNFDRYWDDYKYGFGDLNSEYWIGRFTITSIRKMMEDQVQLNVLNIRH